MQEYTTHSREETVALGRTFARTLPAGALIAFTGGLGAGKTAFCQGLAEGLGCTDPASSPTFAIVNYSRWRILTCTASMARAIWLRRGSTTTWIWGPWWPASGAKTAQTCWSRSIPSTSTSKEWTTTPGKSRSDSTN